MSGEAGAAKQAAQDMALAAAQRAKDRANTARWDLNVAASLFAVLLVVIILVSQDVALEVVAPIAAVGLGLGWSMGWRKGKKLYGRLYEEELSRLVHESPTDADGRTFEESVADAVQKALRERFH